ncbi:DUF4007 family protein [Leptolyngbya sp. FACHB-671]|uniref:DUF4007 family protein n=1 Tax=Leptolyngbya sp. FACHB-671 TaxID=2692812 RepID=UPI0016829962|nr:DUF4007 family protein [Leptolyngbya sp. FACHB-671]MBD2069795.1 DUF4007 family protein [Leptolyngbya sp. FACHB-671]
MVKQISLNLGKVDTKKISVFARHETFHPRFGWIKKGFDRTVEDPGIFLREDAPVRLGVGKNMVRAIRYWCTAFKVLDEQEGLSPTELGSRLLADGGWDPFLEDPASLWLLHWSLLTPPCYATAWDFTFNAFRQIEFSSEDLFLALCDYLDGQSIRVADSSLRKDITCILRMYVEQEGKAGFNEDLVDCPFTELRLLYTSGDSKQYEFQIGSKDNLPAEIIVYACLDFASRVSKHQRTIALSRLAFDPNSPGLVFKLSESAIAEAIERVVRHSNSLFLSDTAGLIQLSYTEDPTALAFEVLEGYYQGGHRTPDGNTASGLESANEGRVS